MKTFRNILFIYLEISLLMNLIFYSLCDLLNFDMQKCISILSLYE